jgi:hypothetical protein
MEAEREDLFYGTLTVWMADDPGKQEVSEVWGEATDVAAAILTAIETEDCGGFVIAMARGVPEDQPLAPETETHVATDEKTFDATAEGSITFLHPFDAQEDPENVEQRTITDDGMRRLKYALEKAPAMMLARPVILDVKGVSVGGNHRLRGSKEMIGDEEYPNFNKWVQDHHGIPFFIRDFESAAERREWRVRDNADYAAGPTTVSRRWSRRIATTVETCCCSVSRSRSWTSCSKHRPARATAAAVPVVRILCRTCGAS